MTTTVFKKEAKKKKGTGDELTTVRGIVIPVDWDENGNALAVAISSPDEQVYFIELDKKGEKILELIRREIEVSGVVRKIVKDRNTITVRNCRLKTRGDWQE